MVGVGAEVNRLSIDRAEPCAICGVALGQHGGGMAVVVSIDRACDRHPWSAFRGEPVPYVAGGEFQFPKPQDWPRREDEELPK